MAPSRESKFYAGASLLSTDTTAPYSFTWSPAGDGYFSVTAHAVDNFGARTISSASTITVARLATGVAAVPASVVTGQSSTVTVSGSPVCGAIEINYGDGTGQVYAITGLPFSQTHTWSTAGAKTITATGHGDCGGQVTTVVTVVANVAPSVALTSPANGGTYASPASIGLAATAADIDGTIARVEFYAGASLLSTDTTAPYSFTWSPAGDGTFSVTAHAVDNFGARTISSASTITVARLATGVAAVPASVVTGQSSTVTVSGSPVCGAIEINYGDGTGQVYPITGLPFSQPHTWSTAGTKTITATGHGDCGGVVTTSLTVTANPPPLVSLTAPAPGAVYTTGATVTVSAQATDSHGVASVQFHAGATLLGTDATAPYSFTWASVPSGVHSLTARAVDVYGAAATSAPISITVNTGPSVALTSPASGSTYAGPASIAVAATAADSDGSIARVEFYAGASLLNTDTTAPYGFTWSPAGDGTFSVTAHAVDNFGARTISSASTITVARLATGVAAVPASVVTGQSSTVTVSGSPVCGAIEINYGDGTGQVFPITGLPFSQPHTWSTAGTKTITATGHGDCGGQVTTTLTVTANSPPLVSLTAPAPGAAYTTGATVTVSAQATDSHGVASVQFYAGATLLGTDTTAPYSFTWASVPSGVHSLTARAVDVYGAAATSAAISIAVNTGPSVALTSPASGSTYAGPASIAMSATASDSDGTIARVEFYAGASLLGTDTTAPYAFTWSPGGYGVFSLTAHAVDNFGARTISGASTVTVARLATGVAAVPASVVTGQPSTITVSGSPVCGAIEINYGDGTGQVYPITGLPFSQAHAWSTAGSKTITATGHGDCGGVVTTSLTVTANSPPLVNLTAPAAGAAYTTGATVTVSAQATDSHGVASVQFYAGATLLGTDITAPYSFTWASVPSGVHSLTARAVDVYGAAATSAPISDRGPRRGEHRRLSGHADQRRRRDSHRSWEHQLRRRDDRLRRRFCCDLSAVRTSRQPVPCLVYRRMEAGDRNRPGQLRRPREHMAVCQLAADADAHIAGQQRHRGRTGQHPGAGQRLRRRRIHLVRRVLGRRGAARRRLRGALCGTRGTASASARTRSCRRPSITAAPRSGRAPA